MATTTHEVTAPTERHSREHDTGRGPIGSALLRVSPSDPRSSGREIDSRTRMGDGRCVTLSSGFTPSPASRERKRSRMPSGGATLPAGACLSASSGMACTLIWATDSRNLRHESHVAMCSFNSHICAPPSCPVTASAHISSKRLCPTGQNLLATSASLLFFLTACSKSCAQGRKPAMQIESHYVWRFTEATSNFFSGQSLVVGHLNNGPLAWFKVL